jgi:hypothetical protein
MTCPTLNFVSGYRETFGAPFVPQAAGQDLAGRWVTIPAQPLTTVVIAGHQFVVTVLPDGSTVFLEMQSMSRIVVARPMSAPLLRAAVFRSMPYLIVLEESAGVAAPRSVRLHLVQLVPNAQAVTVGPYTVPANVTVNVADGMLGQLLLFWHDSSANPTGRVARVARTDRRYPGFDAIVAKSSATEGTNLVACRVTGATRMVQLLHNVTLAGPDSLNLANAQVFESREIKPGKLSVTPNQLSFADTVDSRTVVLRNQGDDMLEIRRIDGMPAPGGTLPVLDVISARPLPTCLYPGESLQVDFRRLSNSAGSGTYVVTCEPPLPAAEAAEGRIKVDVAAAAAQPLLDIQPTGPCWLAGVVTPKSIRLFNQGNIALRVTISPAGNGFTWTSTSAVPGAAVRMLPRSVIFLSVRPPNTAAMSEFTVSATDDQGAPIGGSPFTIRLESGCRAKVNPGELAIGLWVVDPQGPDIAPEGELIELRNVTDPPRQLDLSSVRVTQETFPPGTGATVGGTRVDFFSFSDTTLNGDRYLPIGGTVRILTRAKTTGDPPDFDVMPWRVYAGRGTAVWNNTGDRAEVRNREPTPDPPPGVVDPPTEDVLIDSKVFSRDRPRPQGINPLGTGGAGGVAAPSIRVPALSRRYFIPGHLQWNTSLLLEDGDVVVVRSVSGTVYLNRLFGVATSSSGPAGQPDHVAGVSTLVAFENYFAPMPGVSVGALVGRVRQGGTLTDPFYVGAQGSFRVRTIEPTLAPLFFDFGINDTYLGDNSGEFDAAVDVYRS